VAFKTFLMFFSLQALQYLNITIDYRAVAYQQYAVVVLCNLLAPCLSWIIVVKIRDSGEHNWLGMTAVALGGAVSSVLGIWLTRHWG
jgi:hypothetical protein